MPDKNFFSYVLSQGLADNTVVAKVNKVVWDLDRPLETDCTLELLKFEDEEAQAVSVYPVSVRFTGKTGNESLSHCVDTLLSGFTCNLEATVVYGRLSPLLCGLGCKS